MAEVLVTGLAAGWRPPGAPATCCRWPYRARSATVTWQQWLDRTAGRSPYS